MRTHEKDIFWFQTFQTHKNTFSNEKSLTDSNFWNCMFLHYCFVKFFSEIVNFWCKEVILTLFASKNEIWHGKTDIITTYNPHLPNIDAISGALVKMSSSILIPRSQCDEDARDSIDIWYVAIFCVIEKIFLLSRGIPVIFSVLICSVKRSMKGCMGSFRQERPAFNLSAFIIKLNQPSIPTLIKNIQKFHSENFMIFHAFGKLSFIPIHVENDFKIRIFQWRVLKALKWLTN